MEGLPSIDAEEVVTYEQPGLPVALVLSGPPPGAHLVRSVAFEQQPVVSVVGADGEVYTDVSGEISLTGVGDCTPTLRGTATARLEGGVATFSQLLIDKFACLGTQVSLDPGRHVTTGC